MTAEVANHGRATSEPGQIEVFVDDSSRPGVPLPAIPPGETGFFFIDTGFSGSSVLRSDLVKAMGLDAPQLWATWMGGASGKLFAALAAVLRVATPMRQEATYWTASTDSTSGHFSLRWRSTPIRSVI